MKNENDRLRKQLNNNSNNSSKPPSSDIKPNKKDIQNNREKSGKIVGGQISGSILNALSRFINTLFELGRSVGSSLRRITNKNMC